MARILYADERKTIERDISYWVERFEDVFPLMPPGDKLACGPSSLCCHGCAAVSAPRIPLKTTKNIKSKLSMGPTGAAMMSPPKETQN